MENCIQNLGALLTPIIAVAVMVIAYLQWRTAHQKVVLDLFEKRLEVFENIITSLKPVISHGSVKKLTVPRDFLNASARAKFLFGNEVIEFIDKTWETIIGLGLAESQISAQDDGQDWVRKKWEAITQLSDFENQFSIICEPYISMREKRLRTPFRWIIDTLQL